jgi:hypothetical protein
MEKVFTPQSNEYHEWESIKMLMRQQEEATKKLKKLLPTEYQSYELDPTKPNIDLESPRGFRLLLSQMGFFLPHNRKHITPLKISDSIISEMETLDMLNE